MTTRRSTGNAFSWKGRIIGGVGIGVMLLALAGMLAIWQAQVLADGPHSVTQRVAPRLADATPPPPPWLNLAIHVKNPLPSGNIFTADDVFPDASAIAGSSFLPGSLENTVEYVTLADKRVSLAKGKIIGNWQDITLWRQGKLQRFRQLRPMVSAHIMSLPTTATCSF
jgi:hypothetical protein